MLYAYGVVREDVFVEKVNPGRRFECACQTQAAAEHPPPPHPTPQNALQLKGRYVGHTSPLVSDVFAAAKGGTLFLDEAYALAGISGNRNSGFKQRDCFANDAIATLLTEAGESHRGAQRPTRSTAGRL